MTATRDVRQDTHGRTDGRTDRQTDNIVLIYSGPVHRQYVFLLLLGTEKERGIKTWRSHLEKKGSDDTENLQKALESYNTPFTNWMAKYKCSTYVPFLPTLEFKQRKTKK